MSSDDQILRIKKISEMGLDERDQLTEAIKKSCGADLEGSLVLIGGILKELENRRLVVVEIDTWTYTFQALWNLYKGIDSVLREKILTKRKPYSKKQNMGLKL